MYSIKALFQKQPVVIAGAIRSILFVAVLAGLIVMDSELLAGIALTAEVVLGLFVWNGSTPVVTANEQAAQAFRAGFEDGMEQPPV